MKNLEYQEKLNNELIEACENDVLEDVIRLIAQGAYIECKKATNLDSNGKSSQCDGEIFGETPLLIACSLNNLEIVKFLVRKKADIEAQETTSQLDLTPLLIACENGNLAMVKFLVENNAASTFEVNGAIDACCQLKHYKIAKYLIEELEKKSIKKVKKKTKATATPEEWARLFENAKGYGKQPTYEEWLAFFSDAELTNKID